MTNKRKVVVVTGGANGIGLAISEGFIRDEYFVVVIDKNLESCTKLEQYLESMNRSNYKIFNLDASEETVVQHVFEWMIAQDLHVDVLVNNVAISPKHNGSRLPTNEISLEEWNEVLKVNLTSMFLWTKYSISQMKESCWGRVINITSVAGRTYSRIAGSPYAASKAAMIGFSRTVASEFGEFNITINNIAPGRIQTNMARESLDIVNENFLTQVPLRRYGEKNEIVDLVLFIASERSSYITGSTIDINGGIYMN